MTDLQAKIVDYLRTEAIAMTAQEIADRFRRDLRAVLDDLRALEDAGQVCGAESGFYRVANVRRRRA
jgi:predicted DNA-binding transcriptional regulator YafY